MEDEEFRGFVAARGLALLRTAYLLTGDQQLAEDLVQTSLEKAVRHWSSIRASAAAESYVRTTMYREQVSLWRRRRISELSTDTIPEPRRPASAADGVETRLVLRDALMQLGRRQRAVVVLRYFEDLTEQQVADALGISVGTVKSQAHKALAHLRSTCADLMPATGGERR
ncbi:MAG: SigE family RNA polymerase sigma factor [Sporichthyaceae bacterium]|nr:SigE family RNA polymerase sigma factor [Sporichthyaceae bacterium]